MIFIIITFVISVMLFIYTLLRDKYLFINIKMYNVEEKINSTLIKRKSLLKEAEKQIKDILNTKKQIFEGIEILDRKKLTMMELDQKLNIYISEFHLINEKYKKLKNNEEFQKIVFALNESDDLLDAYKEYYNDTVEKYNAFIKKFPINVGAFIKRKKQKQFFDKVN